MLKFNNMKGLSLIIIVFIFVKIPTHKIIPRIISFIMMKYYGTLKIRNYMKHLKKLIYFFQYILGIRVCYLIKEKYY